MLIDSHCHIYKEYYDDIDEIINSATLNGVVKYINCAVDIDTCNEIIDLSNKYSNIFCCLGIHPESVDKVDDSDLIKLEELINNSKAIAIGEIGLDYYYTKENKNKQIWLFEQQLKLAEKYNLPVVIHSREATLDTIECLKKFNVKGVIHSFSGSVETANIYIKMGFLLGINGVITFKNCNLKDVYKLIDINNIILETDSPYLTPVPYRGKQNSPARIKDIAIFVADLYNISLEELENITLENIKRVFDI